MEGLRYFAVGDSWSTKVTSSTICSYCGAPRKRYKAEHFETQLLSVGITHDMEECCKNYHLYDIVKLLHYIPLKVGERVW